jgi:hypothetical protein
MSCPVKFRDIMTFYKYYSGEKVAPVPTLFSEWHAVLNTLQYCFCTASSPCGVVVWCYVAQSVHVAHRYLHVQYRYSALALVRE